MPSWTGPARLSDDWLRDRHQRWPLTANPYLLVSQQTVADDRLPPVSTMVMNDIFRPLRLSPSKLRQDRILDEARHIADPVHLMRVFGIAAETAMKYIVWRKLFGPREITTAPSASPRNWRGCQASRGTLPHAVRLWKSVCSRCIAIIPKRARHRAVYRNSSAPKGRSSCRTTWIPKLRFVP